MKRKWNKNKNI